MLIADASEHVLSGPATVLLILGVWIVLLAAAFIPWRRIFSRDFWTHPTIAQMQADMLRELPLLHRHRQQAKTAFATTEEIARHCRELSDALYGAGFHVSDFGRKS